MSYSIQKEMVTETAHRLHKHEGKCRNIHGHSYKWEVSIKAEELLDEGSSDGMVLDFKGLKEIMRDRIECYDHALLLAQDDPILETIADWYDECAPSGRASEVTVYAFSFQPTAENLAQWVHALIECDLERYAGVEIEYVRVWETATSSATYRAGDVSCSGDCCGH